MGFFNFGGGKNAQNKNYDELLVQGIKAYNNNAYEQAVVYFDQGVEIQSTSFECTHSNADRSALCNVLMLRGRSLFMMKKLQEAHFDFMKIYALLGGIAVQQDTIKDCKLLRQVCEFGAATAEQTGDTKKQKELLEKRLDISRRIFETTEMAEDYTELGDSYDYMITISESRDEKILNAEKMKEVFQNLHKRFPDNAHFSERLDYASEAVEDQIKAKIADALKRDDNSGAASGYEQLANTRMEKALGRKEARYEDLDKDIELFHEAAKYYQKAGNFTSAIKCLESAIQLRSAIVKATGSDYARARLCYSYVMAITTDPTITKRGEYAQSAYTMLDELEKKRPDDSSLKRLKDIALRFMY